MTKIYRYILATDNGMAPCVYKGLVTLATCKPKIRRKANVGDWVAGFYPRPHPRGLIAYAGKVRQILEIGEYERVHRGRPDAVYREKSDGSFTRLRPEYHPEQKQINKDLSGPVLIFEKKSLWYFGDKPKDLPIELLHLQARGQGHRVNGASEGDILDFEKWLLKNYTPGIHGQPRNKYSSKLQFSPKPKSTC